MRVTATASSNGSSRPARLDDVGAMCPCGQALEQVRSAHCPRCGAYVASAPYATHRTHAHRLPAFA